jgi:hypothetical protein
VHLDRATSSRSMGCKGPQRAQSSMNSVNLSASTSTFGRSTEQRNTNRLSRNVNAIIDVEHPQMEPDEEADTLPPLMGRTLHGRGWDMDEAWHELESSTHHLYLWYECFALLASSGALKSPESPRQLLQNITVLPIPCHIVCLRRFCSQMAY